MSSRRLSNRSNSATEPKGGQVVALERDAAGVGYDLRSHCPEHLQPGEPAVVLAASTAIAPPQPGQIHFGRDSRCRFRVTCAEFDHARQVK